jgi:hypothetical protein
VARAKNLRRQTLFEIHYVFPFEKYGAKDEEDSFGFTAGAVTYDTDPTRPIGDWKEAWEKAEERAGAILRGEGDERKSVESKGRRKRSCARPEESPQAKADSAKPALLRCRFHDLRHTAVTRLLEGGIPYPVVASMVGWSAATAIRMAKRYGHNGSQALRDAADVLGRVRIPVGSLKKVTKVAGGRKCRCAVSC